MGMEKLTPLQKQFVQELANLAYGRGTFDKGAVGGKGNMGLIRGTDGQTRIVKFNTHRRQENTAQKDALTGKLTDDTKASRALREELQTIAHQLGMDDAKTKEMLEPSDKPLLTRKIVAQFISKIAGKDSESIWRNARTKADLTSATDMSFDKVTNTESEDYRNTYEKYNRKVEPKLLNDLSGSEIVEEDDRITMGANTPLFEKSFRLYVHDLKFFAEIEKQRYKSNDVDTFLKSAGTIAENRGDTDPEVHDFLRTILESGGVNPEKFAGKLLEDVGFPKETVESDKLRPLKTLVIELLESEENLTFGEFLGKFKTLVNKNQAAGKLFTDDELKNALVKRLLDKTPGDVQKTKQLLGVFGAEERFTYKSKSDKTYTSGNVPYKQVLKQHNCSFDSENSIPMGLSVSSLTVQGRGDGKPRTLSRVNRFGSDPKFGWTSKGYKTLAVQTFLENPTLLQDAKNGGTIEVPIYRFDLAPDNKDTHRSLSDKDKDGEKVTFTNANNEKITVTLVPKVTYLQIPIDSFEDEEKFKIDFEKHEYKGKPTVLSNEQVKTLHETIMKLTTEAQEANLDDASGIATLGNQLKEYDEYLKSQYLDQKKSITYSKTIGHEMLRVGARLALLASKLGHVPSINCNYGRDRTGAMDNEIKMLALQIEEKKDLAPIRQKDEEGDRDKYLRSELLVKNGENDLARQIQSCHPVNTNQSEDGTMNFGVLFDNEYLKEN